MSNSVDLKCLMWRIRYLGITNSNLMNFCKAAFKSCVLFNLHTLSKVLLTKKQTIKVDLQ